MRFLILTSVSIVVFATITIRVSKVQDHSIFITGSESLYSVMKKEGSFGNSILFLIIDNIPVLKNKVSTGEYILYRNENSLSFLLKLLSNKSITRKITFKEGCTVYQVVNKLNKNKILTGSITEMPEEGSLMPDTYFYKFGNTRQSIINRMRDKMNKIKKELSTQNKTPLTINEIMILASIIEKEVNKSSDKALVSSVYHNRLNKKMRLQSDTTIVYALTYKEKYNGELDPSKITYNDLWTKSPYNTYRKAGLPPTPICCPSKISIFAALNPANTDYLYFISDIKTNITYFSTDFNQHVKYKKMINNKNISLSFFS